MTDTKQTMREHLRQHGLPEAWAEWAEWMSVSKDRPSQEFTVLRPRPPERVVTRYDEDGFGSDFERTDDEMLVAWKEYAEAIAKWCTEHGSADHGKASVMTGAEVWEVKLAGGGASLLLGGGSGTGPWRAVEWAGRPSGRGISMIESLIVEWFDAEGWLKTAPLPTGTSGMVQGADGWAYPKPLADANVAHWKDVAEKATTEAAKLRGDCRELGAKLAEATTHPRSFVCDEEMRAALFADCAAAKRRGDELEKERDELKAQLAASQSMERQVWRQILEAQRERDEAKDTIATLERTRCQIREALDAPERLTTPEAARRLLAERDVLRAQLEAVRKAAK